MVRLQPSELYAASITAQMKLKKAVHRRVAPIPVSSRN